MIVGFEATGPLAGYFNTTRSVLSTADHKVTARVIVW